VTKEIVPLEEIKEEEVPVEVDPFKQAEEKK
jgi:hypothetical protein